MWNTGVASVIWIAAGLGSLAAARRRSLAERSLARTASATPWLTQGEVTDWAKSAANFDTNQDFEIADWTDEGHDWRHTEWDPATLDKIRSGYHPLVAVLRAQSSATKRTLVAVEDKILTHDMVDLISESYTGAQPIRQMPILGHFAGGGGGEGFQHVAHRLRGAAFVVKPRHLDASQGLSVVPKSGAGVDVATQVVRLAVKKALQVGRRPWQQISEAEAAVFPGVLVQPAYPSFEEGHQVEVPTHRNITDAKTQIVKRLPLKFVKRPLELRVQVMWGRAYMIVFRSGSSEDEAEYSELYITPSGTEGNVSKWSCEYAGFQVDQHQEHAEANFAHPARPRSSERKFLCDYIRSSFAEEVVAQAQHVANKLAAPWLRVDFFVPPPGIAKQWPIVLNEVEYNQAIQYRKIDPSKLGEYTSIEQYAVAAHATKQEMQYAAAARANHEIKSILQGGWAHRKVNKVRPLKPQQVFQNIGCTFVELKANDPVRLVSPEFPIGEMGGSVPGGRLLQKTDGDKWILKEEYMSGGVQMEMPERYLIAERAGISCKGNKKSTEWWGHLHGDTGMGPPGEKSEQPVVLPEA